MKQRVGEPLDIRSIIISPTRELAQQIAKEAEILTKHCKNIQIHTAVGGTGKAMGLRNMHRSGCNVLIATPGRLYDLLTDSASGINGKNMEILVLDEADNLLDQGFADALMDIIKLLPSKDNRQTMLFSATVPAKVQTMINAALKPKHKVLKLVPKGEVLTHNKVEQRLITVKGFENLLPTLYEQMMKEISITVAKEGKPFKAIVFFPTAKYAALAADTFQNLKDPATGGNPFSGTAMIEIHSRLSQPQRERAAKKFREGRSAVLFSSDVVARGMDFPDVTHVFQVGSPRSLEQYIHRIGRTGRGSNSGLGFILLADIEKASALKELRPEINLIDYNEHSAIANIDMSRESVLPKAAAEALTRVMEASQGLEDSLKKGAYLANLGYYVYLGNKSALVASLNRWTALGWGMARPPRVSSLLVQRLGMRGVDGLEVGGEVGGFNARDGGSRHMGGGFIPRGNPVRESNFTRGFTTRGDREGGFKPRESGFGPQGDREGGSKPTESGFTPKGDREGGFTPKGNREGGPKPTEGGLAPKGDREGGSKPTEGGLAPKGDREGGLKPTEGGSAPKGDREGGFKPTEGGFAPSGDREGGFKPRDGGFAPRGDREGGFKPRDGGFAPRGDREGGFKPREGGFTPRGDREGGFVPRGDREGGFAPRGDREGGFAPRGDREGGFAPRGDREGGFKPNGGFSPRGDREGGFKPREGGFTPRGDREGGFAPRGDREGGFRPRDGGFAPRGDRDGGFKPREGGFASREGGFAPRGDREGGFRPRDGGFAPRGDREGGFKPREGGFTPRGDRDGFKPQRPWEGRGRQSPGKRFN